MKNDKDKKQADAARIYAREFQLLEKTKNIRSTGDITKTELLNEYTRLSNEYGKLLKQTIKITRIGDSNQRKLLTANEQIEKQKDELGVAYKKMELLARTDPLTRLSNRRDFLEKFRSEVHRFERSGAPFSVAMGDLDDFKRINDSRGHDCGDYVLTAIADILRTKVRKQDAIARWGGEEFILLLPGANLEGGQKVAEGVRERIAAESFTYKGAAVSVTITLGVCEFSKELGIDGTIRKADKALYVGKQKGKNCIVAAERDPGENKKNNSNV